MGSPSSNVTARWRGTPQRVWRLMFMLGLADAGCHRSATDQAGATCDDRTCAARALVDVLVGDSVVDATPACAGIVVGQSAEASAVLTAGHCGSARRDAGKRLFARTACEPASTLPVQGIAPHPLFRRGDASSGYDFALLTVPRSHCAQPVQLATEAVTVGVTLQVLTSHQWSALRVARVTPLRVSLARTGGGVCRGSSGAPVFIESDRGLALTAIVSGGWGDCQGDVAAGRVDAIARGLRGPSRAWASPEAASQTCAECRQQQALGAGPCGNAGSQCAASSECSRAVTCIQGCADVTCARACLPTGPGAPLNSLLRCTCTSGCKEACPALCGP